MKVYFYPNKGEQNLIFETSDDCVPNIGDTVIIEAILYTIAKKVFYYNKATKCCILYVDKGIDNIEPEKKIKI